MKSVRFGHQSVVTRGYRQKSLSCFGTGPSGCNTEAPGTHHESAISHELEDSGKCSCLPAPGPTISSMTHREKGPWAWAASPLSNSCPRALLPACINHQDFRLLVVFKSCFGSSEPCALFYNATSQMSLSVPHLHIYISICLNPVLSALGTLMLPMSMCSTAR